VSRDTSKARGGFADWLGRHDLAVLLAVLFVVAGVWAFVEIADEVREGDTQRLDERVLLSLRRADDRATPVGPRWLHEMGRDVTALGSTAVLFLVTVAVTLYLLFVRKLHAMLLVLGATLSGCAVNFALKALFSRPRPDVVPHLHHVTTTSFPSGHSMVSAVVYLTLGTLLAQLTGRSRLKAYFLSVALVVTLLVGLSRVYLGVHYPTDVLAGWSAGLAWALVCWLTARWLSGRGAIEVDGRAG
jgi:undecaprenyl-diphosphatase